MKLSALLLILSIVYGISFHSSCQNLIMTGNVDDTKSGTEHTNHRKDVPTDNIIETIPGLPGNSDVVQVWQLDFNCYKDGSRKYFYPAAGIHTRINIGFGKVWQDMSIKPDLFVNDTLVATENFTVSNIINTDSIITSAQFRLEGFCGCYTRFKQMSATPEDKGSFLHDYMYVNMALEKGIFKYTRNPVNIHFENIPNGTYQVLFVTSDWQQDRRWNVKGESFNINVPHAPRTYSITKNSALSPEFTIEDHSIDLVFSRFSENVGHDASIAGIVVMQLR